MAWASYRQGLFIIEKAVVESAAANTIRFTSDTPANRRLTMAVSGMHSLQTHKNRAEHWVVVQGTARATRGDEILDLNANQSTYIPTGVKHRLEHLGSELLRVIEIQFGDYLGEDDIVRFDDVYGRAEDEN